MCATSRPQKPWHCSALLNDFAANAVRAHPDRLQAFATLATPAPAEAARELERAVTKLGLNGAMLFGRTRDRNLDDPANWPIFEAAAALRAPLYLHPQSCLGWAIEVIGIERILFSTDYPFEPGPLYGGRRFLEDARLSDIDRAKIASGNWDRLIAQIRR